MGYVPRHLSAQMIRRLERHRAPLLMAGGRLPDGSALWIDGADYVPGSLREVDTPRWYVATSNGWTNIASALPLRLVLNAPRLYFRAHAERNLVLVDVDAREPV